MCADSWAVTVWRIASAARLCQPRVTGLSTATQSPNSMAPLWLLSRPVRRTGPAGRAEARARAVPGPAGTVGVSHYPCRPLPLASGPTMPTISSGLWLSLLRQDLADSEAGPGGRISRSPRPGVTLSHVPTPSPLPAKSCSRGKCPSVASRTAGPAPFPVKPCIRCKPRIKPGPNLFRSSLVSIDLQRTLAAISLQAPPPSHHFSRR